MGSCSRPALHRALQACSRTRKTPVTLRTRSRTALRTFSSTSVYKADLPRSPLFQAVRQHDPESTAVVHSLSGRSFTYGSLLHDVAETREKLLLHTGEHLEAKSVAFLIENSYDYVVTLLAIFACGARAVPLSPSFPPSELRYFLSQSQSVALLSLSRYDKLAVGVLSEEIGKNVRHVHMGKLLRGSPSKESVQLREEAKTADGGLMLYTSGTTARPKGVLLHQDVLVAQAKSLLHAWEYSPKDRLLHLLPLHHIHGVVNAVLAPLLSGSTIEFMSPFNAEHVWRRLAAPFLSEHSTAGDRAAPITFLTAVPTIWSRLLQAFPLLSVDIQTAAREAIQRKNLRLNISGSAALPVPVKQAWSELSGGNALLERYGMTEVGMALSCGLVDEDRMDGSVGWPLPSVEIRLINSDTNEPITSGFKPNPSREEQPGEIQLRGPTVFKGYWRDSEATRKNFTSDGWFKTGDVAVRRPVSGAGLGNSGEWAQGPAYFILGRESADIIKMGGEKISALEVERELLSLPEVQECAVVALPSDTWGQKVAAVVVLGDSGKRGSRREKDWGAMDVRRALKGRLAAHKIPQVVKMVESIPRNAMGKVNKKELVVSVFGSARGDSSKSVPLGTASTR